MDEREWHTFVTVVEEGNISKAATKLFLSQPALSYRLKNLEDSFGYPLMSRSADGICLTTAGEIFYEYCKRMIREKEEVFQRIHSLEGRIEGTLRIASSINFADYELPALLRQFTEIYPDVHIQVKTGYSQQVHKMFNAGECMLAIARGHYKQGGQAICVEEEPYYLVYKEKVTREELADLPLIKYRTDPSISMVVDDWVHENMPQETKVAMELDSMVTCRHFVREGLGWSILPAMGLGKCKDEGVYTEPITDKKGVPYTRPTYLYCTETNYKMIVVKTFVDYICDYYNIPKDKRVL